MVAPATAARLVPGLTQRQTARMTPALREAIRLLQLSNLDLEATLEAAIDANPLLRAMETEGAEEPPAPDLVDLSRTPDKPGQENVGRFGGAAPAGLRAAGFWSGSRAAGRGGAEDLLPDVAGSVSLQEHVAAQIPLLVAHPADQAVARHLAGSLDHWGYLAAPANETLEEAASACGVGMAEVQRVLGLLQRVEPAGLFARDLGECLSLQLADQDRLSPELARLLANLALLESGDKEELARRAGVEVAALPDLLAELRTLNPHPGEAFSSGPVETRVPDLLVRPAPAGGWTVELNPETLPRAVVDRAYAAELRAGRLSTDDRTWIREQLAEASWLVRALNQRAATLLQVAAETLRRQQPMLARGAAARQALTMQEVAADLDMHESTVSRAVSGKHVATPQGVVPLRQFFAGGLPAGRGASASPEQVQAAIQDLVENEAKPLSDEALARQLRAGGLEIARRTVAKYRQAAGIPAASARRKLIAGQQQGEQVE